MAATMLLTAGAAWAATSGTPLDAPLNGAMNMVALGLGGVGVIGGVIGVAHHLKTGNHGVAEALFGGAGTLGAGVITYNAPAISGAVGGPAGALIHATTPHLPLAMALVRHLVG